MRTVEEIKADIEQLERDIEHYRIKGIYSVDMSDRIEGYLCELQEYKQAEHDGQLVVLPCKVGDIVYSIERECVEEKCEYWHEGSYIFRDDPGCRLDYDDERYCNRYEIHELIMVNQTCILRLLIEDSIGESVFLTKAEAEQALKEMEGKE